MNKGLYLVQCQGYQNIYVMADSFDHARQKWLGQYINIDEDTGKPSEELISPMPDTIAFLAEVEEVIL